MDHSNESKKPSSDNGETQESSMQRYAKEGVGDNETKEPSKGVLKESPKENLEYPRKELSQTSSSEIYLPADPSEPSNCIFPWTFPPKWPLTRAERIWELQQMASHYESTPQKDNVAAAIKWHAQFPADEIVPQNTVMFQKGRKIEESEFRHEDGQPWEEGCCDEFSV